MVAEGLLSDVIGGIGIDVSAGDTSAVEDIGEPAGFRYSGGEEDGWFSGGVEDVVPFEDIADDGVFDSFEASLHLDGDEFAIGSEINTFHVDFGGGEGIDGYEDSGFEEVGVFGQDQQLFPEFTESGYAGCGGESDDESPIFGVVVDDFGGGGASLGVCLVDHGEGAIVEFPGVFGLEASVPFGLYGGYLCFVVQVGLESCCSDAVCDALGVEPVGDLLSDDFAVGVDDWSSAAIELHFG